MTRSGKRFLVFMLMGLLSVAAMVQAAPADHTDVVPAEDYPIIDVVVATKFLTSQTRVVVVERLTATNLHPDESWLPSLALFDQQGFFDARLPPDLVRDFVAKNQRQSKFEGRFSFGVRYRFVSGDGAAETEAGLLRLPVGWHPVEADLDVEVIDRLAFSRVGLNLKADQALVYVANQRPDATGAGFLLWLVRRQSRWQVYDTDVIWVSRPDDGQRGPR
jgi:hypothetical protein